MALEIFKTMNDMNPSFMKDLFSLSGNTLRRPNDLKVPIRYSVKFGDKSLKCLGPIIWNSLPSDIKSTSSLEIFKNFLKTWYGPTCKCNLCCVNFKCLSAA